MAPGCRLGLFLGLLAWPLTVSVCSRQQMLRREYEKGGSAKAKMARPLEEGRAVSKQHTRRGAPATPRPPQSLPPKPPPLPAQLGLTTAATLDLLLEPGASRALTGVLACSRLEYLRSPRQHEVRSCTRSAHARTSAFVHRSTQKRTRTHTHNTHTHTARAPADGIIQMRRQQRAHASGRALLGQPHTVLRIL